MAIEFRCQQCQHLLRVGDEAAGKKARCPQCGNIQGVPAAESSHEPAAPQSQADVAGSPTPAAAGANPFADRPDSPVNPYGTPTYTGPPALTPEAVRSRVQAPAIALLVVAILGAAFLVFAMIAGTVEIAQGGADDDDVGGMVILAIMLLRTLTMLACSVRMWQLKNLTVGYLGAILAVIPCSFCCFIEMAFGIWALVALSDPAVKATFQN